MARKQPCGPGITWLKAHY